MASEESHGERERKPEPDQESKRPNQRTKSRNQRSKTEGPSTGADNKGKTKENGQQCMGSGGKAERGDRRLPEQLRCSWTKYYKVLRRKLGRAREMGAGMCM
ncbi:hypothetical protein Hte_000603 [Hypoxylon texense]